MGWEGRVVLDTNVVVAGLRSRNGASFRLLEALADGRIEIALSVPLVLEYEDVLKRGVAGRALTSADVDAVLDYFCAVGRRQEIFFLWRPFLPDPQDDMLLELALAAECGAIVTHNVRHFTGATQLGVEVLTPAAMLHRLEDFS